VNRYQFVADHQRRFGVKRLSTILGTARSSFSYWRRTAAARTAAARATRRADDAKLAARMRTAHRTSAGTHGVPRFTAELREDGGRINHWGHPPLAEEGCPRHALLGLAGLRLRRKHRTTVPDPAAAKAPDLSGRDLTADMVNRKYVGDTTQSPAGRREVPVSATVTDLAARRLGDRRPHANRTRHRRSGRG
jgi:hypothetical protein